MSTPIPNENVRVETGVRQGDEVSIHYDPMIAKLVVWGKNRIQALDSLIARLNDYHVSNVCVVSVKYLQFAILLQDYGTGNECELFN